MWGLGVAAFFPYDQRNWKLSLEKNTFLLFYLFLKEFVNEMLKYVVDIAKLSQIYHLK